MLNGNLEFLIRKIDLLIHRLVLLKYLIYNEIFLTIITKSFKLNAKYFTQLIDFI